MKSIPLNNIFIKGDLAFRSGHNFLRLEGEWYRPDEVFTADKHGWPGDWEGRIILALVLLGQSTHREPAFLGQIIEKIPGNLNKKGYFGEILPSGINDEQQMAGNSWYLRSIIEYYLWKKDETVMPLINMVLDNLLIPSTGNYAKYPLDPENRFESKNWKLSKLQSKTKIHSETSDAGCAFIALDGATKAYELTGRPDLKNLIEEMISRYKQVDFKMLKIQTHATLSALRGIMRMYEITGDSGYLELVKTMFDFYKTQAFSEAYGNYNWFDLPRWTEPCAIIDSFILSTSIWKNTLDTVYLEDAHHIYHNAIAHGQRTNGSLGTDVCVGAKEIPEREFIKPVNFEVYWCCTMRGGEGFAKAIEYNMFINEDTLFFPFYNELSAHINFGGDSFDLDEKTDYPFDGNVKVALKNISISKPKKLAFFIPSWSADKTPVVKINGAKADFEIRNSFAEIIVPENTTEFTVELELVQEVFSRPVHGKNSDPAYHGFMYGPMLLGIRNNIELTGKDVDWYSGDTVGVFKTPTSITIPKNQIFKKSKRGIFKSEDESITLETLCEVRNLTKEGSVIQVLFKEM